MDNSSRISAFLAYLLSVVGILYALIFRRKDKFASFHAIQSLGLLVFCISIFLGWVVSAWILLWVPLLGFLSMGLFSLVVAAAIYSMIVWIIGMINALKGKTTLLPFIGKEILNSPLGHLL